MLTLATEQDKELVQKVFKESKAALGDFDGRVWKAHLTGKTPYRYYIEDGKGFIRYGYSKKKKLYVVKEVGVLIEHRDHGVARTMFSQLRRPLYLTCNIDNDAANLFYQKIGMTLWGETRTKTLKRKMYEWIF